MLARHDDVLGLARRRRVVDQRTPEGEAGVAPLRAHAVGRGLNGFRHASLGHQGGQLLGPSFGERAIEPADDLPGVQTVHQCLPRASPGQRVSRWW